MTYLLFNGSPRVKLAVRMMRTILQEFLVPLDIAFNAFDGITAQL